MSKYLITACLLFFPCIGLTQEEETMPCTVTIEFKGPRGTSSNMQFHRTAKRYTINYHLKIPLYKIVYESKGYLSDHHLNTQSFSDSRNGHMVAITTFKNSNKTVSYGKVKQLKTATMIGHSYDVISLPWEISLNPNLVLDTFQITNGKNVYLMQARHIPIDVIKQTKRISLSDKTLTINVYDLKSIKGSKTTIQFGYSPQYRNLPVYIKLKNNYYDIEFIATSITVDGQKIL